jgi:ribosomal protein S18 acetylase RimI-like enzyme
MNIRPYTEADWVSVRTLYDLSKPDEMRGCVDLRAVVPLENDAENLTLFHESTILVMEDVGRILGFGGYRGNQIEWLFVHPEGRRKGVATRLMLAMLEALNGTVTLYVGKNNRAARQLYDSLGFALDQEFLAKFHGHDVEAMRLKFNKS